MKAEHADTFKLSADFQNKYIHLVFEQVVPDLERDAENGEIPVLVRQKLVEVAAVRLNFYMMQDLADNITSYLQKHGKQDNKE